MSISNKMSSIVLLSTLLIVTVSNSNASGPSQGCSLAPNDETSGLHWFEVTVPDPYQGEVRRSYDVYVPASYDSEATPVLLDFHGYTANADIQFTLFPWRIVADEESFIYVAMNGMNDVNGLGLHGSWNCSSNEGPLGITCDLDVLGEFPCYRSCAGPSGEDCSYLENSCDWSSCHDDVVYTEVVLQDILDRSLFSSLELFHSFTFVRFCIDTDSIHVSGMSNGGMFIWSRILERMTSTFASVGPVCSAPLRGFNPMPEFPISIIDFHGLQDSIIPMSPDAPADRGPGKGHVTSHK